MSASQTRVTVGEVWRLALPEDTQLLAGRGGLSRPVMWTCVMRPSPPAFPRLDGGELALLHVDDLQHLDDLTLPKVIQGLHGAKVAGVAAVGRIDEEAIRVAESLGMPLFRLPDGTVASAVERDVIRLIVDREAALARFRSRVARDLAEIAVSNRGWDALAEALASASHKTVVIQDGLLRVLGRAPGPAPMLPLKADELDVLAEPGWLPAGEGGIRRYVLPLRVEGVVAGYLSLLGLEDSFDASDEIIAEEGALLGALELAKARAVSGAEAQRRAQFLQELLHGGEIDPVVLRRRAQEFRYDPTPPQVVLVVGGREPEEIDAGRLAQRMQEELSQRQVMGFVANRPDAPAPIVAIFPVPHEAKAQGGRRLAAALIDTLRRHFPSATLVAGVSRPLRELTEVSQALEEADQAWSLGRRLAREREARLIDASELGVYRVLLPLEGTPVLKTFYEEALGQLEAYDQRQGTDLLDTLEAYFDQLCNLSRTAEVMHLHRNTLIYRLDRIAQILDVDLDDADVRLSLQLALKARRLL
ncbi:MAG: PucR family transcriptional regulator [Anaerolineae bacterium]